MFSGIIYKRLKLRSICHSTRWIIRTANIDQIHFLVWYIGYKAVLFFTRHINQSFILIVHSLARPSGNHIAINIYRIRRVLYSNHIIHAKNRLDICRIRLGPIAHKNLRRIELNPVFCIAFRQSFPHLRLALPAIGIAAIRLHTRHLIHRIVQTGNHAFGQRLGRIANAQSHYGYLWMGIEKNLRPPRNLGKQIPRSQFVIICVNPRHVM